MFKTILVATDRVTGVDAQVMAAIDLAALYHADLHVLHVLEPLSAETRELVRHFETAENIRVTPSYAETVANALKASCEAVAGTGAAIRFHMATGLPWEEILRVGREVDTDLIVVGPHAGQEEKQGLPRADRTIGSTAQSVIAREPCPVMIVGRPVKKEKLLFRKIIIGIDFSVSCECALCLSVKLSRDFGSTLYPFFMLPVPPYPKYSGTDYKADKEVLRQKLEEFCDIYLDGIDHDYQIWGGVLPHQEVLNCARTLDADLIMLGSHTKKSNGKWYAGSVVERVSHGADCPVLSVNDPQALERWKDIRLAVLDKEAPMDRSIHVFHGKSPAPEP